MSKKLVRVDEEEACACAAAVAFGGDHVGAAAAQFAPDLAKLLEGDFIGCSTKSCRHSTRPPLGEACWSGADVMPPCLGLAAATLATGALLHGGDRATCNGNCSALGLAATLTTGALLHGGDFMFGGASLGIRNGDGFTLLTGVLRGMAFPGAIFDLGVDF